MASEKAIQYDADSHTLICKGEWNLTHLPLLENSLQATQLPPNETIAIDGSKVKLLDSAGAWLLLNESIKWQDQSQITTEFKHFTDEQTKLLSIVANKLKEERKAPPPPVKPTRLEIIGKYAVEQSEEFTDYLNFIGHLFYELLRIGLSPTHWRIPQLTNVIYRTGLQALPIIGLLSFMIGVVITFQMGLQLRNYGANIFIVDLLGLSILREFGPLLTAIMVAGRTGSAFTAELGMMKLNQEIDALNTMGVTPAELLLIPRIIGLFIALPLLCMWADIFGVFGGMVMANNMLNITWYDFIHRFPTVIPLRALLIGIGKAPIFALIIASIGCFEGMRVKGGADSIGRNTTRSVVLAIFFIIVADALFSVIFSKLKL